MPGVEFELPPTPLANLFLGQEAVQNFPVTRVALTSQPGAAPRISA